MGVAPRVKRLRKTKEKLVSKFSQRYWFVLKPSSVVVVHAMWGRCADPV